jgi:uncharacterized membrane protein YfcA
LKEKGKAYRIGLGAVSGFLNGLLGTGGGLIVLTGLAHAGERQACAHATATACTFLYTLFSAITYTTAGHFDLGLLLGVVPGMAVGGYIGARLLGKLPERALKLLLGGSLMVSGAMMVFLRGQS